MVGEYNLSQVEMFHRAGEATDLKVELVLP